MDGFAEVDIGFSALVKSVAREEVVVIQELALSGTLQ